MVANAHIPSPASIAKAATAHRIEAEKAAERCAKRIERARRKAARAASIKRNDRALRDWAVAAYGSGELSKILDAVRYGEETGWDQPFIMLDDFGDSVSIRVTESRMLDADLTSISSELDDDLIEAQDWDGLAAHLTRVHAERGRHVDWNDYGNDYMSGRVREWDFAAREQWLYADRVSVRAGVHIRVVGRALSFTIDNYLPEFTAAEAKRLATAYKPEEVERASLTPRERVERVLSHGAEYLFYGSDAVILDPASDPGVDRLCVRIAAEECDHGDYISVLAQEAHVYDEVAEAHIVFIAVADEEVDA